MRGTANAIIVKCQNNGITPAHAGNSAAIPISEAYPGDHPRTCGEQPDILDCTD